MTTVIELLEAATASDAQIHFQPSGISKRWDEVWADSERVARHLVARVGRGAKVGALLSNTPGCPEAINGVWRAGCDLVSLSHPGRGATPESYLKQVLTACSIAGVELLLMDETYRHLVPEMPIAVATFQELIAAGGPATATDGSGGLVQFTSGSVGSPKGVVLSGEAIAANVLSIIEAAGIQKGERACSWLPMSHDMGFIGMYLSSVCSAAPTWGGESLTLLTPEYFLSDPRAWLQACSDFGVQVTTVPNFAMELATRMRKMAGNLDLSSVRVCISGAERISTQTLEKFTGSYVDAGFAPEAICPAYGMAEAALAVTMTRPADHWRALAVDAEALGQNKVVPVGDDRDRDVPGVLEYVGNGPTVSGNEVRIVADGIPFSGGDTGVGEVQIRGTSLLDRYIGADLQLTDDGWFPTRDVGFLQQSELFLVGRSDDTIIVGGANHYAADIEGTVHHEAVRKGCLAAVPLAVGYALVAEPAANLPGEDLKKICRELARVATQRTGVGPSLVGFVPRGSLPKTPSGKIQRKRLAVAIQQETLDFTAYVQIGGAR